MKIYLDTVGCRLNQAEIDKIARQFQAEGHLIVRSSAEADAIIINTCAVTSAAAADSRQKIRASGKTNIKNIFITGCWSQIQPTEAYSLPNVAGVITNSQKDNLVQDVISWNLNNNFIPKENIPINSDKSTEIGLSNTSLGIFGTGKKTRSFIKIQDGCNNSCTFCITTIARGKSVSIPAKTIIEEIQQTILAGAMEIVLTGVNLGSWGSDIRQEFTDLITSILKYTDVNRLRLSSLEPWDLSYGFFSLWSDDRICPHLHLPLQSGSESTLKRMRRKTTPNLFRELVNAARIAVPEMAITTDLIVGFPGESAEEFKESMEFVEEMNFAGGHVFRYSTRQGTLAATFDNQVDIEQKKERSNIAQNLINNSSREYKQKYINRELPVLWEANEKPIGNNWQIEGLTENYIKVKTVSPIRRWNTITNVKLIQLTDDGMSGIIT